jgi:hypothetical protein
MAGSGAVTCVVSEVSACGAKEEQLLPCCVAYERSSSILGGSLERTQTRIALGIVLLEAVMEANPTGWIITGKEKNAFLKK